MGTKTISIMDDVYERLIALKRSNESFSDEIRRLTDTGGDIMDVAGAWKNISNGNAKKLEEAISRKQKSTRMKEILER